MNLCSINGSGEELQIFPDLDYNGNKSECNSPETNGKLWIKPYYPTIQMKILEDKLIN